VVVVPPRYTAEAEDAAGRESDFGEATFSKTQLNALASKVSGGERLAGGVAS